MERFRFLLPSLLLALTMLTGHSVALLVIPLSFLLVMLLLALRLLVRLFRRPQPARLGHWSLPAVCLTIVVMVGLYGVSLDIAKAQTRDLFFTLQAGIDDPQADSRWPCGIEPRCSWSAGLFPATYDVRLQSWEAYPVEDLYTATIWMGMDGAFQMTLSRTGILSASVPDDNQALDPETLEPITGL